MKSEKKILELNLFSTHRKYGTLVHTHTHTITIYINHNTKFFPFRLQSCLKCSYWCYRIQMVYLILYDYGRNQFKVKLAQRATITYSVRLAIWNLNLVRCNAKRCARKRREKSPEHNSGTRLIETWWEMEEKGRRDSERGEGLNL